MGSMATPRARSPRRRWRRWLVVVVLLWLIGRGLGWFGNAGDADPDAANALPSPAVGSPSTETSTSAAASRDDGARSAEPAVAPQAAPTVEAKPTPVPATAPESPDREMGLDADRFASKTSAVQHALDGDDLAAAEAAVTHLVGLPLSQAQQASAAELQAAVQQRWRDEARKVVAALRRGAALEARLLLVRWWPVDGGARSAAIARALQAEGVALEFGVSPPTTPVPIARPLARGRAVRVRSGAQWLAGTIADGSSEQVTVRIPGPRGVTFPTVPLVDCEPVEARGDEALELAFAALHRGDGLLARLWLAVAREGGAAGERLQRLAELLR